MIKILSTKATKDQINAMLEIYGSMIKIAVDIRKGILAGGGEMHADCEQVLLDQGSEQDDLWGANWYPKEQRIEYEAIINIRPQLGNRSILIQNQDIRNAVENITKKLLGDVN